MQSSNDCGVQIVVQARNVGIVPVHCKQVLGEVVGANREEIDVSGKSGNGKQRRRHLQHGANRRCWAFASFHSKLATRPVDRLPGRFDLIYLPDHREHDAQVVQTNVCAKHRPKLGHEDVGAIQGKADATPTKKRVLFRRGEIGQRFVAPNIKRSHGHRLGCERLENPAIDLVLLLLHRKSLACHERKLGAIEPDLFDAEVCGDIDVGQQSDI